MDEATAKPLENGCIYSDMASGDNIAVASSENGCIYSENGCIYSDINELLSYNSDMASGDNIHSHYSEKQLQNL